MDKIAARAVILVAVGFLCSACSITRLDRGDGSIETTYTLLSPVNQINLPADGGYLEIRGVGVTTKAGSATVGLFDIKALAFSPNCHLVVVSATDEQIESWRKLLKDTGPLCSPAEPRGGKSP